MTTWYVQQINVNFQYLKHRLHVISKGTSDIKEYNLNTIPIARSKIVVSALYSIKLRKQLVIGQFSFSSIFLSFSMVTINSQTSHDSGILRQDYGIILGLPMGHQLGSTGGPDYRIGLNCRSRA